MVYAHTGLFGRNMNTMKKDREPLLRH